MIKNIIFDFGGVLTDWDPHYLYDDYFKDQNKADWFVKNVCNDEWNAQMDAGKPFSLAIKERIDEFPDFEEAIRLYQTEWMKTMGEEIPGMYELIKSLKDNGFPIIYGLTNWSAETFPEVREKFRIFELIDRIVVSGEEKLLKPNPLIYNVLLDRYHLAPNECLFIDDKQSNVDGAIKVGMHAVKFNNAEKLKSDLRQFINL